MKNKRVKYFNPKANKKGKYVKKGDQCIQNPTTKKHRDSVKKNVFSHRKTGSGLTTAALELHDEIIDDEISMSDTSASSNKSKAFSISGLTDCSNITFHHVLNKWSSSNLLDQEKCAILAAVTEVIRSKGGSETESEYFAALMTALEASNDENSITAISFLLSLVIKKIPNAILKTKFSDTCKSLVGFLEKYYDTGRASMLISLLQCLSATLLVQEPAVWQESSTQHIFQIMLTFTIHSKPKVRKLAHSSLQMLLKLNLMNHKKHPIEIATANFAVQMIEQHADGKSTTPHHILNLLKQCLQYFSADYLEKLCSTVLGLLEINNNPILKRNTMETLSSMFDANPSVENLSLELNIKLVTILYEYQPNINDVTIAGTWLTLMLSAHTNLSLIHEKSGFTTLPFFFGKVMKFLLSENRDIVLASADIMEQMCENCIKPAMVLVEEDIKSDDSIFVKIFHHIESGLGYKYAPVWDLVLKLLQYMYLSFGKNVGSVFIANVGNLIDLHQSSDFPFMVNLDKVVGAAIKSLGPELVLKERPLDIIRDDNVCQFSSAWLLPVMKNNIEHTELEFFITYFLPMAAQLRQKGVLCRQSKEDLEAKVYETLQSQIWSLLPGFCTNPIDLKDSFQNVAKIMGTALTERSDLRPIVLQALRTLISTTSDEEDLKCVGNFSKNYLPILFNLYTSDDCQSLSLSILETIKVFLIITETKLISVFIKKLLEKMKGETSSMKKHELMDLAVCMVRYSESSDLQSLFTIAVDNIKDKDKSMQKKSYRILEEILDSNSESCQNLKDEKFDELKSLLVDSLSSAAPSSKAPRLRCLSYIVKALDVKNISFLQTIIPEVILCTKAVGVKARAAAFDLIVDIGSAYVYLSILPKEDCIEQYFQFVMAGLAGSTHMISATLLTFTKLLFEYRYCIPVKLVATLLESAIELLKSKTNEVIKASLLFIRAVVRILDSNELTSHLEIMVKNLFLWNTKNTNANRTIIRSILEKLDKKCGYELIRSLVPTEHRKFMVHIHKTMERKKRQQDVGKDGNEDKTKETWEDIMAESDEEEESKNNDKRKANVENKGKKQQGKTWIVGDETVDLLGPGAARQIVGTKPKKQMKARPTKDFSLSSDGRFVINDEEADEGEPSEQEKPLDIGKDDMLGGFDKTPKQIKLGKRKQLEEMPDSEESSQYQPGGVGIHRKEDGPVTKQRKFGDEYKAKKSDGDVKLKGKPDPYAYVPLNRDKLNKRKKAKLSGQFHGMVKAARKGAKNGKRYYQKKK